MHTPGPWRVGIEPTKVWEAQGAEAFIASMKEGTRAEQEANARLIAAAPEMYALLKAQTPDYPLSDCAANQRHIAAQKIIASIEGR
jgi:hypothetical protein